jgi:hypothetical protein
LFYKARASHQGATKMRAEIATKTTTLDRPYSISFNKKELKEQGLSAAFRFENMRQSLEQPLMGMQLTPGWRTLLHSIPALNDKDALLRSVAETATAESSKRPILSLDKIHQMTGIMISHPEKAQILSSWIEWINSDDCLKLAPEYRALLGVYYLQQRRPFGSSQTLASMLILIYMLRCAGYADMAEGIVAYLSMTTQKIHYDQTQWILHYLAVLQRFLEDTQHIIQQRYQQALFDQARLHAALNERQEGLIEQLMLSSSLRDKKSLTQSAFYRALYAKQSRRTQERDFKELCDKKLILMKDASLFILTNGLG